MGSILLAVTVGVTTATAAGPLAPAAAANELPAFDDCAAFTKHMAKIAESEVGPYGMGGGGGGIMVDRAMPTMNDAAGAAPAAEAKSAPAAPVGNGPTGTNLQERGVDEPDVAKIDGNRVVSLTNGVLTIVDASGNKPKLRGTMKFPPGQYPTELFVLDDHRALVLGTAWEEQPAYDQPMARDGVATDAAPAGKIAPGYYRPSQPKVVLTLVDMSNAAKPTVVRSEKVTGSYVSARLTGDTVRMVFTSQPRINWTYPRDNMPVEAATARNRAAVRNAKAADWLPMRQIFNKAGKLVSEAPLMGCKSVRHPVRPSGVGILSVLTMNMGKGGGAFDAARGSGVVGNGELVYSSTNRLYVATTEGGWGRTWDGQWRPEEQRTKIHAFDVTGAQSSPYVGTGTVPGFLYGRWALSEHKGKLRVATTSGQPWGGDTDRPSQSSVIVLDERGDRLVKIGSVGGLGKTERIRAVRWFDDLAAIVTFRQTDPLYMVDISDPTKPKVQGQLKIPGYSAYLHPVGGDILFGVGQNADKDGRVTGLQVSAFDVSDTTNPTRKDAIGLGRGWTDVEHDSRAFTFLPNRRLAIVPAWVMQKVSCPPNAQCMGTSGGDRGFVGEIQVPSATGIIVDADGDLHKGGRFIGDSAVVRVLPIGDRLVAITQTSVVLLNPDGLKQIGSVRTAPEYQNGEVRPMR